MQETPVWSLGWEDPCRRDRLPNPIFLGFLGGSAGKESTFNAGDLSSIPGLGRSPREYPLQCSDLENSMDCIVHGATKGQTQLSNFHSFLFLIYIFFSFSLSLLLSLLLPFKCCYLLFIIVFLPFLLPIFIFLSFFFFSFRIPWLIGSDFTCLRPGPSPWDVSADSEMLE